MRQRNDFGSDSTRHTQSSALSTKTINGSAEHAESLSRGSSAPARSAGAYSSLVSMQRKVGNAAMQRMIAHAAAARGPQRQTVQRQESSAQPESVQRQESSEQSEPVQRQEPAVAAASSSATPPAAPPAIPTIKTPPDLKGKGEYHTVYKWLKEQATKSKKTELFGFFDKLSPGEKMGAIRKMANEQRYVDLDTVKSTMLTGVFSKSVDWDKFSTIVRSAVKPDMSNYNADQTRDYAAYTAIGTSGAAGGTSGSATISAGLGASDATGVADVASPIAGGLGGVAAISQIYNASQSYDSSMSATDRAQLVVGEGGGGTGDLVRSTAGAVEGSRKLAGMAASGAANVAAGVGGIVGGAGYLASGVAGYRENKRNAAKLEGLEREFAQSGQEQLGLAAHLGGSTQRINQSKNAATAVKGALMIAGGAVLLAAAASPAGPILLAAAAILGGIAAVVKFYKKYKRKTTFVDKALRLEEAMAKPENKEKNKDEVRQAMLESHGFNSVDQCYVQLVTDMSNMLFDGGVKGDDEQCQKVIEGMGLKIDKKKQKPGKDLIAKKLHA